MAAHKRKTKDERYSYTAYSYWGTSVMYWTHGPNYTNLFLRIDCNHFDYNILRAEVKRLLHTEKFVLLNRWRAMSNEYRSFIQFHERETASPDTRVPQTTAGVGAEHR